MCLGIQDAQKWCFEGTKTIIPAGIHLWPALLSDCGVDTQRHSPTCCKQDKDSVSSLPLKLDFDIQNNSIKHLLNSLLLRPEKLAKTSSNQLLLPNPTIKLLSISLGYYCIKTELICTISMIYILPLYLFWKARSGTCQIIVYMLLLVSPSELGNVLYTVGKVFSMRFQRNRDLANWIMGSGDIQGASLEKEFRRNQFGNWGLYLRKCHLTPVEKT